jgi:hypothetical protein
MIRRVLRKVGRYQGRPSTPLIKMFRIFADTTSRIGNFQAHGETDSTRRPADNITGSRLFRPINLLPTLDIVAVSLNVTAQTREVQQPRRLIKFGRPAWSLYAQTKVEWDIRDLASTKLFRCGRFDLKELFKSSTDDANTLKFLARICSHLAIQTGSYVTATSELMASHMMVLERVGDRHDELESRYVSEPVLAEVAAEATGLYGWDMPLRTLVSEMWSSVVTKGFRGEFITRAQVIIAMEDAQRKRLDERKSHGLVTNEDRKKKGLTPKSRKYWDFSQVESVCCFLDALLQDPDQLEETYCDDLPPLK